MSKGNLINFIGMTATIISMASSLLSNWVNDQKMNTLVDEKVNEALAKKGMEKKAES